MLKNPYPGKFIVFDGIDGCGKSTQIDLLEDAFRVRGILVHTTAEPTSSLIGGLIRGQIAGDWKTSNECLQLLFSADRLYHVEKEIIPMLKKGISVLCDRYFFSTIAYGAVTMGDPEWLLQVNNNVLLPDLVIVLDIDAGKALERIHKTRHGVTLFDKEPFLSRVRENMKNIAGRFQDISVVLNADRSIEETQTEIQGVIQKRFSL